jgi:ParB family chromosome partitioning protein
MAKKSGLGRGLGAILDEIGSTYESQFNEAVKDSGSGDLVTELDINLIEPNPYQPRKHFDEERLQELSNSIKKHGLLQPIVVINHEDRYILIAGERRLRASKIANLDTIKAIVADIELDELRLRELALIENIQRENLNAIELANSYKELIEVHNITHDELSNIVHKSRSQITNTLRLLNLDEYAQNAIIENKISQGHAKILVTLPKEKQKLLVDTIIGQKLSVREVENIAKKLRGDKNKPIKDIVESKSFKISKEEKEQIEKMLPFDIKIKKASVEILLDSQEKLDKFISFISKTQKN